MGGRERERERETVRETMRETMREAHVATPGLGRDGEERMDRCDDDAQGRGGSREAGRQAECLSPLGVAWGDAAGCCGLCVCARHPQSGPFKL